MNHELYVEGVALSKRDDVDWIDCVVDKDYEICTAYPYPIRDKRSKSIIAENIRADDNIQVFMHRNYYIKHRVIALQFIPNPNNYRYVRHLNGINYDNRIENLIWTNSSKGKLM